LDLDSLYRRQMKERLTAAGIEWEGWHGFRRGLATNLERIGVRESIAAMVLRHSNDRVTRKHYIKPPTLEAIAAMRQLSETLLVLDKRKMLPNCSPEGPREAKGIADTRWVQ
jgi:integrase